jgi:opacity protein-like surface antigen
LLNILYQSGTFFVVLLQQYFSVTLSPFSCPRWNTTAWENVVTERNGISNEVSEMNMFKTIMLAGAVLLPMSVVANATDIAPTMPTESSMLTGFYLRGDVGASFLNWSGGDNDTALVAGGGVGYQYNDFLRMDLTGDFSGGYNIAPGATIDTTTILGNVYFDWKNGSAFTPYIGGGVGYGWAYGSGFKDDAGLAVGLAAGVAVDLTNNLAVDVGYRFRDIMISGDDPTEHQVTAGLRFKF